MSSMYSQERDRAFPSIDDKLKILTGLTTPNIDVKYWWLVQPSTDVEKRERASLPWHPKGGTGPHLPWTSGKGIRLFLLMTDVYPWTSIRGTEWSFPWTSNNRADHYCNCTCQYASFKFLLYI
jgi:hypothetical protein